MLQENGNAVMTAGLRGHMGPCHKSLGNTVPSSGTQVSLLHELERKAQITAAEDGAHLSSSMREMQLTLKYKSHCMQRKIPSFSTTKFTSKY